MYKRYEGKLVSSFSQVTEGEDIIKDAELFTVGTHRERNYSIKDLQRLASNFTPEERIPLQLDHSESVKDTVGYLEGVSVKEDKLMGSVRIIDEDAKKKASLGLFKKVSISFYTDFEGNPDKIREVSLVAFPQVKSAQLFREHSPLEDLSSKMTTLQLQVNHQLQFNEIRLLAQQIEQGINKLTKEKRAKQAQEGFENFYEDYTKSFSTWKN